MKEMCLLFPHSACANEAILIMNPNYEPLNYLIWEYLETMGFTVLEERKKALSERDAWMLFEERFENEDVAWDVIDHFAHRNTVFYYVVKSAAQEEINAIFWDEDPTIDDILEVKELKKPLLPGHFPYLFMACDTNLMFETGLTHVFPNFRSFTGKDLHSMSENLWNEILENILWTTLIDKIRIENSWKLVERIHTDERDKYAHFMIDSNSSGVYEIKVILDFPKRHVDEFKDWLLAQYDALSIYY